MSSPTSAQQPSGDAKAKALVDAFLEEKAKEAPAVGPSRSPSGRAILTIALTAACAGVWFAPLPSSAPSFELDPLVSAASARVTVFLAATKVQDYRAKHGRLPGTLAEAKVSDPTLAYARLSDSVFTLQTTAAGQQIELDSRRDPREVLGGAVSIIERNGKGR